MSDKQTNWACNYEYHATRWHYPETVGQLQALVNSHSQVKAIGSRHSFNGIADTAADLISLQHLNQVVDLDRERQTVTVEAGIRYGELGQYLHREGYGLPNLASLPHISVAGACATATHGSGDGNGNLATAVAALQLLTANGDLFSLSRDQDEEQFAGAVVGLGALGIVTQLTLDLEPTFAVQQYVYENLPFAQLEAHFDAITASAYSVSLFTDWQNERLNQVWLKRRVVADRSFTPESHFWGATLATRELHPITALSADPCTAQMGNLGPWHERLPHFRLDFTPSSGEELQSEYFVPRQHAVAALAAIFQLQEQITPHLFISEIRTVAADQLWLSPCYQRPSVAIHFTWKQNWTAVRQLLPLIEAALAPFNGRPHWGKLFTMPAAHLQTLYPKLPNFQRLRHHYDPQGKFHNAFLNATILASADL